MVTTYLQLSAVCMSLLIAGTSSFCLAPPSSANSYSNGRLYSSSSSDGGLSSYEQQMQDMVANKPQKLQTFSNQEKQLPGVVVTPQPGKPNQAQLMKTQEQQMSPVAPPAGTSQMSTKTSDYVDAFSPDPQYFWERNNRPYETSETRWVRVGKKYVAK